MHNQQKFIHLKNYSHHSIGKSPLTIDQIIQFAKASNMPAVAISDVNNMFGIREFSIKALQAEIKPIIGMQAEVKLSLAASSKLYQQDHLGGNVTFLVKSKTGYSNLLKLHAKLYCVDNENDLFLNLTDVLNHSEGLILLTGSTNIHGFLVKVLTAQKSGQIKSSYLHELIIKLAEAYKDNLYLEITRYEKTPSFKVETELLKLAVKYNLPIVATNNCSFKNKSTKELADIVVCIGSGTTVEDENTASQIELGQYLKQPDEMLELFADLPEAIENTINIAKRCNFLVEENEVSLPTISQASESDEELLTKMAKLNFETKFINEILPFYKENNFAEFSDNTYQQKLKAKYSERLNFEIDIITKVGFSSYFLIVSDFINWAKSNKIAVGPGRGSGAGSLTAFILNITDVDPIRFGLIFERFLNPERISMPDFDIDFCPFKRDDVINYVSNKYGHNNVAKIITFGTLQTRGAIRDVGRCLNLPYIEVDRICKRIPHSAPADPTTIKDVLVNNADLALDVKQSPILSKLFRIALGLEGVYRNISTHAAGIVISKQPLENIIPIYRDQESQQLVTGFSMKYIEDVGLVKFDFLGLTTLRVIQDTVVAISLTENKNINLDSIAFKGDKAINSLLSTGKTLGLFQLEGKGMRDVLRQMKPDKLEDIIAVISLYRPGPMENIPSYIKRKHGKEKVSYLHPLMQTILDETFGIMIYQEQVMQIASKLANYSLGASDLLRRAMGKKKPEEMAQQQDIFVAGAKANGIDKKLALKIFDQMAKFAGYGFNKSHATCYAIIAWQTAYLKAHYLAEFLATSMTHNIQNTDKLLNFIEEAKNYNVNILNPDVNRITNSFEVHKNNKNIKVIYYATLAIKGISKLFVSFAMQDLQDNGPYTSVENFLSRVESGYLNKKQLEALIKAGCFDSLEQNRNKLLTQVDLMLKFNQQVHIEKSSDQFNLFGSTSNQADVHKLILKPTEEFNLHDKLMFEAKVIGFFLSSHPLKHYENTLSVNNIVKFKSLHENLYKKASLVVVILKKRISRTRNNSRLITLTCSDTSGVYNIILFGKSYEKFHQEIKEGGVFLLVVKANFDDDELKIFVDYLQEIYIKDPKLYQTSTHQEIDTKLLAKPKALKAQDKTPVSEQNNNDINIIEKAATVVKDIITEPKIESNKVDQYIEITTTLNKSTIEQIKNILMQYQSYGCIPVYLTIIDSCETQSQKQTLNLNNPVSNSQQMIDLISKFAKIELKELI